VVRSTVELMLQALIDLEATQAIGVDRYERSESRTTHRSGTRPRVMSTKAGMFSKPQPFRNPGHSVTTLRS
jgi:putative transposase